MDSKTAEVISKAIEEKEKADKSTPVAQLADNNKEGSLDVKSEEPVSASSTDGIKDVKALPKASAHKSFAVDPELNVGVGIVSGITGPKPIRETFERVNTSLDRNDCTRCKKEFAIDLSGKTFKLCPHCRELQRERSRRWQQKTKLKPGACRRCGVAIPSDQAHFVLCPPCRLSLRSRKASRYENGKCVHCSGLNDSAEFKVCTRCRTNDKQRRKTLEERGCCNRCANPLQDGDKNHKVCASCRSRKKNVSKSGVDGHNSEATITAVAAQASDPEPTTSYQQVAQQLEANLFAQEQGREAGSTSNDESIQALAQATTSSEAQAS